ncbi:MAG: M15 family metallopeptidase [Rikenellaceae bacterium]|jgi:D-alanyl-D-alanine dipeptidase|nr:M15 family metallopeptidase [Rikenellaceae bacterium]
MKKLWIVLLTLLLASCGGNPSPKSTGVADTLFAEGLPVAVTVIPAETSRPDTPTEARLRAMGLVDIAELDPSIDICMVYATPDNFMGRVLYDDLHKAFMLPATAEKLMAAQRMLRKLHPEYSIRLYDAARPMSVQQQMWNLVKGTDKRDFVSNPARGGGLHNYGAAVDVTIIDPATKLLILDMGSPYDYFGDEARVSLEAQLLRQGRITQVQLDNRLLLRKVMTESGFRVLPAEWWHFNLLTREEARRTLPLIE